jgi:8-oxo-dGTP pyrophosphatase MutT (NUDIX family)
VRSTNTRALVEAFDPGDDVDARASRDATLALLDSAADPFARTAYDPGHVTGSAIVFAPDGRAIVLVEHARVGGWVQPGGHVDPPDPSVEDAARREVAEETGLVVQTGPAPLVRVDVHPIPPAKGEPAHHHHDLTFAMVATARAPARPGEVSWAWCAVDDLDRFGVDDALRRSLGRAQTWFDRRPAT